MKMKIGIVAAAMMAALTINVAAQPSPCPECEPCTNCPPYTNAPFVPQDYPLDTLLVRVISITNSAGGLVYTNYGWALDTNNLLISAGGSGYDITQSAGYPALKYTLGITNTYPSRVYSLQFSTNVAGPYSDVGSPFYGTTNRSEFVTTTTLSNLNSTGFWRAKMQPGFVLYTMAATNGFGGGGSSGGCPGPYTGYINYVRRATNGWGYTLDTNVIPHAATDLREPTNRLELGTIYGYFICGSNTVSTTSNAVTVIGDRARFSIFFRTYPTNQAYPLWVKGFIEPTNAFSIPSPQFVSSSVIGGGPGPFDVQVSPFIEMDTNQMNWNGFTTNDLITGEPDNN
jgi:hypothetical protein